MPPTCPNGKFPCILKYYGMNRGRCDKPLPSCMFRDQKREQDPVTFQETRDDDPHYQEFEGALKKLGGGMGRPMASWHQHQEHQDHEHSERRSDA